MTRPWIALAAAAALFLAACSSQAGGGPAADSQAGAGAAPGGSESQSGDAAQEPSFDAEAHFSGRTITLIIPYAEGSGVHYWAERLIPAMEKAIPGHPRIQVESRPGAGGVTGSNYFWQASQPDGLWLLMDVGTGFRQAFKEVSNAQYDVRELPGIGAIFSGDVFHGNKPRIQDIETFVNNDEPWFVALRGIGAVSTWMMTTMLDGLGVDNWQGVQYPGGAGEVKAAIIAGEVDFFNESHASYNQTTRLEAEEGRVVALWQPAILLNGQEIRHPQIDDIPTYREVYRQVNGEDLSGELAEMNEVFSQVMSSYMPMFAGRNTPDHIVEVLRSAYEAASRDPVFIEKSMDRGVPIPTLSGEEATEYSIALSAMPQRWIERHKELWKAAGMD